MTFLSSYEAASGQLINKEKSCYILSESDSRAETQAPSLKGKHFKRSKGAAGFPSQMGPKDSFIGVWYFNMHVRSAFTSTSFLGEY